MIEIDGSQGEGGGQILRTALALSLVTQQPFRLVNIRAKRPKPGLMRQHLACVQAAVAVGGGAAYCMARNGDGGEPGVGDTALVFTPAPVQGGHFEFAVGSAGSSMLVLQTVLWPLVMARQASTLVLRGGTHNPMAPSFTYLSHMAPYFAGTGPALYDMQLVRHGFYPAGGGEVHVRVQPTADGLAPIALVQRGALVQAWAECLHAGVPASVAERELGVLQHSLGWSAGQLRNRGLRSNEGPGNVLQAVLQFEHITEVFTAFGDRGVRAETVAHNLAREVQAYVAHEAPVGEHLADQLMIPMALAGLHGRMGRYWTSTWSEHASTNARVIGQFVPVRFATQAKDGGVLVELVRKSE